MENRAKNRKMLQIPSCLGTIFPVSPRLSEPVKLHTLAYNIHSLPWHGKGSRSTFDCHLNLIALNLKESSHMNYVHY